MEQVIPLRRTQKYLNKIAAHHSVVIFIHSMEEADKCLKHGMFIKGRYYSPEKYTPELNITQCYKCYKFGHLAKHCKNKQNVGTVETKTMAQQTAPMIPNVQDVGTHTQHGTWNTANATKKETD